MKRVPKHYASQVENESLSKADLEEEVLNRQHRSDG